MPLIVIAVMDGLGCMIRADYRKGLQEVIIMSMNESEFAGKIIFNRQGGQKRQITAVGSSVMGMMN